MGDIVTFTPKVREESGRPVVNTRDLAADPQIGKRHANILRDVDKLLESLANSDLSWLTLVEYTDEQGKLRPSYDLTKNGFTLLAMSWSGPKWIAAKMAYIQRFDEMEKALREVVQSATQIADRTQRLLEQNSVQLLSLSGHVTSGFASVHSELRVVNGRLDSVEKRLPDKRRQTGHLRGKFAAIVAKCFNGLCPCGCGRRILEADGSPIEKLFVIDHKEGRGNIAPHQLWPQHRICNQEYEKNGRSRDVLKMAVFEAMRKNLTDNGQLEMDVFKKAL